MVKKMKSLYLGLVPILVALLLLFSGFPVSQAQATDADIILGIFYDNDTNNMNTLYVSDNGSDFKKLQDLNLYQQDGKTLGGMSCPSIMYKDGYFWRLSGWNKNDGKIWPMISYSSDLITWTAPEGNDLLSDDSTKGVSVDSQPDNNNGGGFDIVAPEWFLDSDNNVYIIVSCGYYGAFHGNPTVDQMDPYIIEVNELSAEGMKSDGPAGTNYKWPNELVFKASPAKRMRSVMNATGGADYIDGSITKEGDTYYLYYKRNGVYIDVYTTNNLLADNWTCQGQGLGSTSYEGPYTIKFNNQYMLYADQVVGDTAIGVQCSKSSSLISGFGSFDVINFYRGDEGDRDIARHGSLMVLHPGTPEYNVVKSAMANTNTTFDIPNNVSVYRLYNEITSEHLYTTNLIEYNYFATLYSQRRDVWQPEGIAWYSPSEGDNVVYRLYNPGLGALSRSSHYYTTDVGEVDWLVNENGWVKDNEINYFISGGDHPVYHAYSEPLRSGHLYTASFDEYRGLDGGWDKELGKNGFASESDLQTSLGTGMFKCSRLKNS